MNPDEPIPQALPTADENLAILREQVRQKLGWATLETRKSDRLDFHEVAVWDMDEIIRLAFNAGIDHARK